jgi:hypothetical protein
MEKLRDGWRREMLHLGLATMEICWLLPWLSMLTGGAGHTTQRIWFAALLSTLLLALYVTRVLSRASIPLNTQRVLTPLIALASSLTLVRATEYSNHAIGNLSWLNQFGREVGNILQRIPLSLIIFFVGLYLWWRGISLAQRKLDAASVGFSFRVGIVAFLWLYLVAVLGSQVDATPNVLAYFFVSFVALGLARIEGVSNSRKSIVSPFNASWLGILTGSTLVVCTLGLLATRLFSLQNIAAVLAQLHPLVSLLKMVARPLLLALAWLLELILNLIIQVLGSAWASQDLIALDQYAEQLQAFQHMQRAQPSGILSTIFYIIQWGVVGSVAAGTLCILALSINRRWRALQAGRTGEHASAWEGQSAAREVRNTLDAYLHKLRDALLTQLARLRAAQYSLTSVRRIYASLVRLATAAGCPRHESETPYEYAAALHKTFPSSTAEIVLITDAYVRAHYGEISFHPEYVQRVRDAWLTLCARQEQRTQS